MDSRERQQKLDLFRNWVLEQKSEEYQMHPGGTKNQKIIIETDDCRAELAFYPQEIVELCVISKADEQHVFYLHFQMNSLEYAKERFQEMLEAVRGLTKRRTVNVLLSCSCGMTTYYFMDKLNQTAKLLNLDYEFTAVSYTRLYSEGGKYDAIFLAPQVSYLCDSVKKVLPQVHVEAIPPKLYASYDVRQFYELLEDTLKKEKVTETFPNPAPLLLHHRCRLKGKMLTIAVIRKREDKYHAAVRLYGPDSEILDDRNVIKKNIVLDDFYDICDIAQARHPDIQAISIAMPGIINDQGVTMPRFHMDHMEVADILSEKYKKPVMIENDANCIALGYYASQKEYQSLSVLFQPVIGKIGGMGSIHEGRLIKGLQNVAGEIQYMPIVHDSVLNPLWGTPEGVRQLASQYLSSVISILGPELIVLVGRLFCDIEKFREELLKIIPESYLPQIRHICDVRDYMLTGAMITCGRVLEEGAG